MIRPEVRAVKGERSTLKWNSRHVFYRWRFLLRVETRDAPILVPLLRPAQDVDQSSDERVARDLSADVDLAQNISAPIELQNAMLVPLTQVEMITVKAEV